MYKRVLSLVMAAALCLALAVPAIASQEPDSDDALAEDSVQTTALESETMEQEEPVQEAELVQDGDEAQVAEPAVEEQYIVLTVDGDALPDNDELFSLYLETLMYDGAPADYASQQFTGDELTLYKYIKGELEKIAAGENVNTEIIATDGSGEDLPDYTSFIKGSQSEIRATVSQFFSKLVNVLLIDCPEDLYWFDKTAGVHVGYSMKASDEQLAVSALTFSFAVAEDYAGSQSYTTNAEKIASALTAIESAKALAAAIRSSYSTDYERLAAIRDAICERTSYNYTAANGGVSYGDPWQMIYVFDNDPDTKVVCEGYAKATQYLCDLALVNAQCYTVSGKMGTGNHMWNIVTISGNNYLLDLTNCDSQDNDDLREWYFLRGASGGSVTEGYQVPGAEISGYISTTTVYTYDSDTLASYNTDILTLASEAYVPSAETDPITLVGDVNGDGQVTMVDVTALFQYVAGQTTAQPDKSAADVNRDDVVNLMDVTRLFQYVAGQITVL